jgi:recombination protein RecA
VVAEPELELDAELGKKLDEVVAETAEETAAALPELAVVVLEKAKRGKKKEVVKEEASDNPHAKLDQLLGELSKNSNLIVGRATTDIVDKYINYERSPFGLPNLNALLSHDGTPENGGAPHGRFVALCGSEGSCKTTLAMECIARRLTAHEDEYALILDAENAVDQHWCARFGVPMDRVIVIPGTLPLEDMATHGVRILKHAREQGIKITMCLVDSLGAMAPAVEFEGKKDKEKKTQAEVDIRTDHVATSARKINQMLRVWAPEILKSNTCCFLIAHMMMDIGGYGGQVMKGGLGLRHFAHYIINLNRKNDASFEKEIRCKDGEIRKIHTGYFVVATLRKARSPYDGHKVALPFMIGVGFETLMSLFNTAVGFKIIEQSGSWFKYNGESIGQGQAKAIEWLETHPVERIKIENDLSAVMYEENIKK